MELIKTCLRHLFVLPNLKLHANSVTSLSMIYTLSMHIY